MSFRITTLLFGLLLTVMFIFGLMLALRRSELDQGFVLPQFSQKSSSDVNYVEISKDNKTLVFTKAKDDTWRLNIPPSQQQVHVIDNKVTGLIDEIRGARHSNPDTDVTRDPERWNLLPPKATVTLKTTDGGEIKFFIGKDSGDNAFTFVNSSERPRDALAVRRSGISSVFLDIEDFRSRTLLDDKNQTPQSINLVENKDGKKTDLVLHRVRENYWRFDQPPLGPADYEGLPAGKGETTQSLSSLLRALTTLRVEEFEPISSNLTIDPDKALLRIEIAFGDAEIKGKGKDKDKAKDKKEDVRRQVLLIGDRIRDKDQYYARLEGEGADKAVVKVSSKALEPVYALIKDPKALRSHDVAQFDTNDVDAVQFLRGKEFANLYKPMLDWRIFSSDFDPKNGNDMAITGSSGLLHGILGRGEVKDKDFEDPAKFKELEARFTDASKLESKVTVWGPDSLEPPPKKEEKKEDKDSMKEAPKGDVKGDTSKDGKGDTSKDSKGDTSKGDTSKDVKGDTSKDSKTDTAKDAKSDANKDAKSDAGKDAKSDGKDAQAKKDDKKEDKTPPTFKKDVKPIVTLSFVKLDKDKLLVKREVPDNEPMYFNLATAAYEKIVPPEMALAFIDNTIPSFSSFDAFKLELSRGPVKERETFILERELPKKKDDKLDPKKDDKQDPKKDDKEDPKKDDKQADKKVDKTLDWKLISPKESFGKGELDQREVDNLLMQLSMIHAERWVRKVGKDGLAEFGLDVPSIFTTVTHKKKEGDKEETKTFAIKIGNKSRVDKDKGGYYAIEEGTDLVFVLAASLEKSLEDAEFRDRQVLKFEPKDVKEMKIWILSKDGVEIRDPVFEREGEAGWKVKSGLGKISLDTRRVDELAATLSELKCVRYLSVKMPAPKDYALEGDKIPLKIEFFMKDTKDKEGKEIKTTHWITIGARQEKDGPYYGTCSMMPGMVFLVPSNVVEPLLSANTAYFSKN